VAVEDPCAGVVRPPSEVDGSTSGNDDDVATCRKRRRRRTISTRRSREEEKTSSRIGLAWLPVQTGLTSVSFERKSVVTRVTWKL
jgi:hypothetical protein